MSLKSSLCLFISLVLIGGCSNKPQSASLEFRISKNKASNIRTTGDVGILSTPVPSDLSEIDCIGVMAGFPDGVGNKGICTTTDLGDIEVASLGGLVPYTEGSVSVLNITKLRPKLTQVLLIGYKTGSSDNCEVFDPSFDPNALGYSKSYILDTIDLQLKAGPNTADMTAELNTSSYLDDCDPNLFSSSENIDLSQSLVGYWDMDNVYDETANNYDFTVSPSVENTSTGVLTSAAARVTDSSFLGYYYNTTDRDDFDFLTTTAKKTINFWVKPVGTMSTAGGIVISKLSASKGWWVGLINSSGTKVRLKTGDGAISNHDSSCGLTDDVWQMVTIQMAADSSDYHQFKVTQLDGTSCSDTSSVGLDPPIDHSGGVNAISGSFDAGCSADSCSMSVDSIGIWNRHLSDDEIDALFNDGTPNDYPY